MSYVAAAPEPYTATNTFAAPAGTVRSQVSVAPSVYGRQSYVLVVGCAPNRTYRSGSPVPVIATASFWPPVTGNEPTWTQPWLVALPLRSTVVPPSGSTPISSFAACAEISSCFVIRYPRSGWFQDR